MSCWEGIVQGSHDLNTEVGMMRKSISSGKNRIVMHYAIHPEPHSKQ